MSGVPTGGSVLSPGNALAVARLSWRGRGGDFSNDFVSVIFINDDGTSDTILAVDNVDPEAFIADLMEDARRAAAGKQFWLIRLRADASVKCQVHSAN